MTELRRMPWKRTLRSRLTLTLAIGALSGVIAAGALAQSGGKTSSYIGKLEGPEVVTDAAKAPKTFKEAPQLAELVKAGKLPPVAERVGQDPAGDQAAARDRQVRRHLARRLHGAGRLLERLPVLHRDRIT